MSGLYDEDGIDGPFERGMARPIRYDSHWVIKNDTAQKLLEAQGYKATAYSQKRGKLTMVLMSKEI